MNSGVGSSGNLYCAQQLGKICMGCLDLPPEYFGECGCVVCSDCQQISYDHQLCEGCGDPARKYVQISSNPMVAQMRPFLSNVSSSLKFNMHCVDMQLKVKNKQIKVLTNKLREARERIAELETLNDELERKKKNIAKKYKEIKKRGTTPIHEQETLSSSISMIQDMSGYSAHQDSMFQIPLPRRPMRSPNFAQEQSMYSQRGLLSTASSMTPSPSIMPSQREMKERAKKAPKNERNQWRTSQQLSQRAKPQRAKRTSSSTSTRGTRSGRNFKQF